MQLFANNAISTLAGAISNVATSMSVQPGHGARFPTPTGGDYFLLTLFELIGGIEANHEIVKVTARSVDTLTIVRAQESTTALAYGVGSQVSARATAGTLGHLAQTDMPTTFTQPVTILTAAPGTNTTQAASTAFVTAAVSVAVAALVASSPAALDTLNELALALGSDANFATTTATSLGNRLRVDAAQGLTAPQKAQGVSNLGLAAVAVSGAKADVGLGNVDNTSDANKPVSTATTTALNLKANLASPTFTGTVTTTDCPVVMNVTTGGAARNFAWTQATSGAMDLKISAAAGGSAVAGASIVSLSATGMILTGSVTGTVADAAYSAKFKGATGMLRVLGYSTSPTGVDLQSVNAAETLFLPIRVIGTAVTLAYSGSSNAVVVDSGGTTVTGKLTATADVQFGTQFSPGYTNYRAIAIGAAAGGVIDFTSTAVGVGNNRVAQIYGAGNGYLVFGTGTNDTVTERMRIAPSGAILVNTTTDNGVDKLQVAGSIKVTGLINAASTIYGAATEAMRVTANSGYISFFDATNTTRTGYLQMNSGVGGILAIDGAFPMTFNTDSVERMRLDASGNLLVGVGSGSVHTIKKAAAEGAGVLILSGTSGDLAAFYGVASFGWNAAATGMVIGKNSSTSRSINAAGTINASGADYAEYMVKDDACGDVGKGDIIGVTAEGTLTDNWYASVSFMVKSTNPSYVGGDTWGTNLNEDELEIARAKVDRIAFAGQVPVNVWGATPGQLILPTQINGAITGVAVDPDVVTLAQYIRAVGTVQNILPDGRANIRVKVA